MTERNRNKNIVKEVYDSKKTSYDIAKIITSITGKKVSNRTVERYEKELREDGQIGYRETFIEIDKNKGKKFKTEFYNTSVNLIQTLQTELSKVKPFPTPPITIKKVGDTLNILISDWHIGRIIKDEIGSVIYDTAIAKIKARQFTSECLKLVDKYISKGTSITNVTITSTGDILDGLGIFATQETLSDMSPPFQVMVAAELIEELILAFLERKLTVDFYGVKGNHGEIRIHGKSKDPNANWDLMLYLVLEFWKARIVKTDKVRIHYSELDYLNYEVRGWKYHARHKAPSQSETAAGKAKFLGWAKKHNFDVLLYGHLHHYGLWDRSGITVIRGGALTAGDEFAETLAEESEPIQLVWGCNEKRPMTYFYAIDLGEKRKVSK